MPLDFRVEIDSLVDVQQALEGVVDRQIPFVTALGLTRTAQDVQAGEVAKMRSVFDRPTPYTLNSLYIEPATKQNLTAVVRFKDEGGSLPASRYLGPEIEGTGRTAKSHEVRLRRAGILKADEYCVPSKNLPTDNYGNVSGSVIESILSQLGAAEQWAGYTANMTARSKKRAVTAGGRYFVLRGTAAHDGIYHRDPGVGRSPMTPVLLFVRQPHYGQRFPYVETAKRIVKDRLFFNIRAAWDVARRTMR